MQKLKCRLDLQLCAYIAFLYFLPVWYVRSCVFAYRAPVGLLDNF